MKKDALISDCGKYRYRLSRIWDDTKAKVLFIMLNPSTADADQDDPTIRRCISFAKSWGYGGIYVGNICAYRATDPSQLKQVENCFGFGNISHIRAMASESEGPIICAWGNSGNIKLFAFLTLDYLDKNKLYHLGLTKTGNPRHPLYVLGTTQPIKMFESAKPLQLDTHSKCCGRCIKGVDNCIYDKDE